MPAEAQLPGGAALPIVYHRARAFFAAFSCPLQPLEALLPEHRLKPIQLWPGKGTLVIAVFDYQETSIGPYREVGLGIPCRYRKTTAVPLLPLLGERWLEDVGYWIVTLPVTTRAADEAGRAIWGYPKYVADIDIQASDERVTCVVSDGGRPVIRAQIDRPGPSKPLRLPLRTYSLLGDELLLTETAIDGAGVIKKLRTSASLALDPHPRNEPLHDLPNEFTGPAEVRWFDEYRLKLDRARVRYRVGV